MEDLYPYRYAYLYILAPGYTTSFPDAFFALSYVRHPLYRKLGVDMGYTS